MTPNSDEDVGSNARMNSSGHIQISLLPGVPLARIRALYERAPGNELASGKFTSPESSAALVANAFGFFFRRAGKASAFTAHSRLWLARSCSGP